MPTWAGVTLLVLAILAADAALWLLVIRPLLRRRMASATREALTLLAGAEPRRIGPARLVGVTSRGRGQVRGTGCLAVADHEVVFVLAAPRRAVRIPRDRVTGVDMPRGHVGRTVGRPLLRLAWVDDAGTPDAAAFDVGRDLDAWLASLRAAEGAGGTLGGFP